MALGERSGTQDANPETVLLACYSLFGFNSKPILYLNVLLFSATLLGLLWAIRKVRGRSCHGRRLLANHSAQSRSNRSVFLGPDFSLRRRDVPGDARADPDRDASRSLESNNSRCRRKSCPPPLDFGGGLVFAALDGALAALSGMDGTADKVNIYDRSMPPQLA